MGRQPVGEHGEDRKGQRLLREVIRDGPSRLAFPCNHACAPVVRGGMGVLAAISRTAGLMEKRGAIDLKQEAVRAKIFTRPNPPRHAIPECGIARYANSNAPVLSALCSWRL